jgi:hypothetical protein
VEVVALSGAHIWWIGSVGADSSRQARSATSLHEESVKLNPSGSTRAEPRAQKAWGLASGETGHRWMIWGWRSDAASVQTTAAICATIRSDRGRPSDRGLHDAETQRIAEVALRSRRGRRWRWRRSRGEAAGDVMGGVRRMPGLAGCPVSRRRSAPIAVLSRPADASTFLDLAGAA